MNKSELALIRAKADLFARWEKEELESARKCKDKDEADEHYIEAIKCGSSATSLRNILIDLGY